MRVSLVAATMLAVSALSVRAEFEGILESKMSVQGPGMTGGGTTTVYRSRLGTRMEMDVGSGQASMKMTTLTLKAKPGLVYSLNVARKTYSEIDTTKTAETAARTDQEKYSVKKLAPERVVGFACTHVLVRSEKGEEYEVWSTTEIGSAADYWSAQRSMARSRGGLAKALREGAAEGWPVKWIHRQAGGDIATVWELVRAEKKAVSAALFDLSGYTKSEEQGLAGLAGQAELSPEQQQRLDAARRQQEEALKKMTPEQRRRYEEMMKSIQGAGAAPRGN